MLTIPFQVSNFAERVKRELELQLSTDRGSQNLIESWRVCNEVLKTMEDQKVFYELEVIELIQQLLGVVEKLDKNARNRSMMEIHVQAELDMEMSHIGICSKNNFQRNEVEMLLQSIKKGSEVAIGQGKESSEVIAREFKRISNEKRWNNLIQSEKIIDLTLDRSGNQLYRYIKVAYEEVTNHPMYNSMPIGLARKYKKMLLEQLGEGKAFEDVQKAFNILCGIGKVGVYYVYIPEK